MSKKNSKVLLVTHCAICDTYLTGSYQRLNPITKEPDDICNACRDEVENCKRYHDKHQSEMEHTIWRKQQGSILDEYFEDAEKDYNGG